MACSSSTCSIKRSACSVSSAGTARRARASVSPKTAAVDARRQHAERVAPEAGGHEPGRERPGARGEPVAAELALEPLAQHAQRGAEIAPADAQVLQIGGDRVGLGAEPRLQRRGRGGVEQARLEHGVAPRLRQLAQRRLDRGGHEGGVLDPRLVGRAQPLAQRGGDGERDRRLANDQREEALARQLQDRARAVGADRGRARLAR